MRLGYKILVIIVSFGLLVTRFSIVAGLSTEMIFLIVFLIFVATRSTVVLGSYQEEHETFMSNVKGASAADVLVCLAHGPALIVILKLVQGGRKPRLIRDVACLGWPMLASVTILGDKSRGYLSLLILLLTAVFVVRTNNRDAQEDSNKPREVVDEVSCDRTFLSLFKGTTMMVTCISILAVDFRIFPRRFAKTETAGVSLMDIGVGAFIVSSALTSKYARGISHKKFSTLQTRQSWIQYIRQALPWRNIAVLLLGVGRMITLRIFNYHQKSSEYGLHWNFFVTLFGVWSLSDLVHLSTPRRLVPLVAVMSLCIYQAVLSYTHLPNFIFAASRSNFISANREGLCSLFAYVPMYLIVESFSHRYFFNNQLISPENSTISITVIGDDELGEESLLLNSSPSTESNNNHANNVTVSSFQSLPKFIGISMTPYLYGVCHVLLRATIFAWILWIIAAFFQPTSRRLANTAYVSLVLAMSSSMMLFVVMAHCCGGPTVRVTSLEYINKSQLIVFLTANIMTGATNLSMKTIYASTTISIIIMAVYTFLFISVAWLHCSLREHRKR